MMQMRIFYLSAVFVFFFGNDTSYARLPAHRNLPSGAGQRWMMEVSKRFAQLQRKRADTYDEGLLRAVAIANLDYAKMEEVMGGHLRLGNNREEGNAIHQVLEDVMAERDVIAPAVETLLKRGVDVNTSDEDGRNAVFWATVWRRELGVGGEKHTEILRYLLEKGGNPNQRDRFGKTATHIAAYAGDYHALELLQAHGANLQLKSYDGHTPYDDARHPLHVAAYLGDEETLSAYLAAGHDVNARDDDGNTPAHVAAQQGGKVFVVLKKYGADFNLAGYEGRTPLHLSAQNGHLGATRFLYPTFNQTSFGDDHKYKINRRDQFGALPLALAKQHGQAKVSKALARNANTLEKFDESEEQRRQELNAKLKDAAKNDDIAEVKHLVERGAEPWADVGDGSGTALHHVAGAQGTSSHLEVAKFLVKKGANINARVHYDHTARRGAVMPEQPIHMAIRSGNYELVEFLVNNGADVNAYNGFTDYYEKGGGAQITPLILAINGRHFDIVRLLLEKGANPHTFYRQEMLSARIGEPGKSKQRWVVNPSKMSIFRSSATFTLIRAVNKMGNNSEWEEGVSDILASITNDLSELENTRGLASQNEDDDSRSVVDIADAYDTEK